MIVKMARFVVNKKSQNPNFLSPKKDKSIFSNKKAEVEIPLKEMFYITVSVFLIFVAGGIGYSVYKWTTSKPLLDYQNDLTRIHRDITLLDPGKSTSTPLSSANFIVYLFDQDYVKENNINQCKNQACICAKKGDDPFYCKSLPSVKNECNNVCVKSSVQERQVLERSFTVCRKGENNNELKIEC